MSRKSLRDEMPNTAAFIDRLRDAFGVELINEQIRRGMRCEPVFYARENGHEVGTPIPRGVRIGWDKVTGVSYVVEDNDDPVG